MQKIVAATLLLVAAAAVARVPTDVEQGIVFVAPEIEVRGVPISVRRPTLLGIASEKLDPHSTYEVTLSYPATTPSVYTVKFVAEDDTEYYRRTTTTRTLQNVHQFFFSVDGDNPPLVKLSNGAEVFLLAVSASPEGKTPLGVEDDREKFSVLTNVFLSRHVAGVPVRAIPVLLFAFGAGVFVLLFGLCVFPKTSLYATLFNPTTKKE